jgi:signal transduction histidine kinase
MRILVVDDYPNSRLTLTAYLKAAGFDDVLTADSGRQAIELLGVEDSDAEAVEIDLILMDILMPEMDGIEACKRIKRCKRLLDIPIIMITSFEEVKYLEAGLAAGALDFMTKPVNQVELLARVRSALALKSEVDRRKRAFSVLEKQMLQAQRLEGFGRLAGALAHDIRNMLTPIMGYSQLGMSAASPEDQAYSRFQEILKAAGHAAELTNRMLVSLRSQSNEPQIINLNRLIEDATYLLRGLIKENIELVTLFDPRLWPVKVDRIMTEQLLMNLAANARDAMPNGGTFTITTSNISMEDGYVYEGFEVPPWDYVVVSVKDTGIGIPEQIRSRIFEPFFTTKEVGKGTGLGLATCATIVSECGGHIELFSQEGKGSEFKVYLPRYSGSQASLSEEIEPVRWPHGKETILVAEDEPSVRVLVTNILEDRGYTVLSATNGNEALRVSEKRARDKIDLLLTDVVMPQMSGPELADRLIASRPNIKVLLTSGYIEDMGGLSDTLRRGAAFIEKPFRPAALACKVRELLDA